jgi:protein gp37
MAKTKIAWTDETWNPVTGCTKISKGCEHCYAAEGAARLQKMHNPSYVNCFKVTMHPDLLLTPGKWRKPRLVFACSMSDLFHEDVPDEFIKQVFQTMKAATGQTFQVLTKRPERMVQFSNTIEWPSNVWAGVTIEHNDYVGRADLLRQVRGARVLFISAEPLLGPLPDLDLAYIDQVIVGGESGQGWRPMEAEWALDLRDRCIGSGIAFFFKQWAAFHPKRLGRVLDGREWKQMPGQAAEQAAT